MPHGPSSRPTLRMTGVPDCPLAGAVDPIVRPIRDQAIETALEQLRQLQTDDVISLIPVLAQHVVLEGDDSPAAALVRHDDHRARARAVSEAVRLVRSTPTDTLISYLRVLAQIAGDVETPILLAGPGAACRDPAG